MLKIGDKVNIKDGSYSFGIYKGKYYDCIPLENRDNLTVINTDLTVMQRGSNEEQDVVGEYREVCDLVLTDGDGNYWFIRSDFCESVDKKIEVRYFSDGKDVTDKISDETKRNLRTL